MEIPKYILKALERRQKAAYIFNEADLLITEFINKHNIEAESYDYCGGVEAIVNPDNSASRIREAIYNHEIEGK